MLASNPVSHLRRTWPGYLEWALVVLSALILGVLTTRRPVFATTVAGLVFVLLAPRWTLVVAAIIAQHLLPASYPFDTPPFSHLLLSDLLLVAFVLKSLARRGIGEWSRPVFGWRNAWLVAFLGWAWFDLLATGSFGTATALARISLYVVVFLFASGDKTLARPVLISVTLYAILEVLLAATGFTPFAYSRALGFYGDPGIFSMLMLAGIAGSTVLRTGTRNALLPLLLLGVILGGTRGSAIAAIVEVGLIVLPLVRGRWLHMAALGLGTAVVGFALVPIATNRLHLNPASILLRTDSWREALGVIASKPAFGVGWAGGGSFTYGNLSAVGNPGTLPPFNLWLYLAVTTGVIGAALFLAFSFELLRNLSSAQGPIPRAGSIYFVGMMVAALGEMFMFPGSPPALEFFIICGACAALTGRREETGRASGGWLVEQPPLPMGSR